MRQSGRRDLIIQDYFDLFHDMDPAKVWALQLKQTVEELELYKNIVNQHIPCTLGNYTREDQGDSFRFL